MSKLSEEELTEEDVIKYLEECNESQDILGFCYIPEMVCSKILDLYNKEKEKNKELEIKLELSKKLYDDACICLVDTVSKDKIRKKIEILKGTVGDRTSTIGRHRAIIELQELLEERN